MESIIEYLPPSEKVKAKPFEEFDGGYQSWRRNALCFKLSDADTKVLNTECGHWYRITCKLANFLDYGTDCVVNRGSGKRFVFQNVDKNATFTWYVHVTAKYDTWPMKDIHKEQGVPKDIASLHRQVKQYPMDLNGAFISVDDWAQFYTSAGFPKMDLITSNSVQMEGRVFIETMDLYTQLLIMSEMHQEKDTDILPNSVISNAKQLARMYFVLAMEHWGEIRERFVSDYKLDVGNLCSDFKLDLEEPPKFIHLAAPLKDVCLKENGENFYKLTCGHWDGGFVMPVGRTNRTDLFEHKIPFRMRMLFHRGTDNLLKFVNLRDWNREVLKQIKSREFPVFVMCHFLNVSYDGEVYVELNDLKTNSTTWVVYQKKNLMKLMASDLGNESIWKLKDKILDNDVGVLNRMYNEIDALECLIPPMKIESRNDPKLDDLMERVQRGFKECDEFLMGLMSANEEESPSQNGCERRVDVHS